MLDLFIRARIERQSSEVLGLMTARLQEEIESNPDRASDARLMAVGNPCWYRYEVLDLKPQTETDVVATVRAYQHF